MAAGGEWERQKVAELRGRAIPVPWPHVARQVGRNEIDLRRMYEEAPAALAPPAPTPDPVAEAAPKKPPGPRSMPYRSGKDPQAPPNLALLLLTRGEITVPDLASRMDWSGAVAKAVMGGLVRGGFVEIATRMRPFSTWRITESGRAKLARMKPPLRVAANDRTPKAVSCAAERSGVAA